ncbi:MAG: TetR/AcrR family transcriptional regulator [Propioniciclava sp.]
MPRPAKFHEDTLLDAARTAVLRHGRDATLAQVAATAGAPIGSLYHRWASRDYLFGSLWLRSIRRFQVGLLEAHGQSDPHHALLTCALHIPRYCRNHPGEALAMTLYRQSALLTRVDEPLRSQVATVNDDIVAGLRILTRQRYGRITQRRLQLVRLACEQAPYGVIRPLVGGEIPAFYDDVVRAAADAILNLG